MGRVPLLLLFSLPGVAMASRYAGPGDFLGRMVHSAQDAVASLAFVKTSKNSEGNNDIPAGVDSIDPMPPSDGYQGHNDHQQAVQPDLSSSTVVQNLQNPMETAQENELLQRWLSWGFWSLLVVSCAAILLYSQIVYPVMCHFMKVSYLMQSLLFFVQMVSFMLVAAYYRSDKAAGSKNTTALATVLTALALLNALAAVSMACQKKDPKNQLVIDDLGGVLQPLARCVVVFLVVHGVLEESGSDYDSLLVFASFLMLGLAFAMTGLMKDLMCYIFIRVDDYFKEGDYIYYQGNIVQVKKVTWFFTIAYKVATRSTIFIPNNQIGCGGCNNQSRDTARLMETRLPLPGYMTGEVLQSIVADSWALLETVEQSGFTGLNGKQYDCQFDVNKTAMYLESIATAVGLTEFCSVQMHLRLFGKYYYSKPPPWEGSGPEPPLEERQMAWKMLWHFQVEWFLLEVKKIIDGYSKK